MGFWVNNKHAMNFMISEPQPVHSLTFEESQEVGIDGSLFHINH